MLTATIGSCLSRRTATRIPGNSILSCVYHCRSDQLLRYLTEPEALKPIEDVSRAMGVSKGAPDVFSPYSVLINQSLEGFGRHDLDHGVPLLEAFEKIKFDLILVDNFIDLVGRLFDVPDGGSYYCRYQQMDRPEGLLLGERIAPTESAKNFERIIRHLKELQPQAKIVFIQFPVNNYPTIDRRIWGFEFRDALHLPYDVGVIPVRRVQMATPGHFPEHLHNREYSKYARDVMAKLAEPSPCLMAVDRLVG